MNRKSFFRLLGKGAAVLAVAPSVLASTPKVRRGLGENPDGIKSYKIGDRTFHVKQLPQEPVEFEHNGKKYFYQQGVEDAVVRFKAAQEKWMFDTLRPYKK